MATKKKPTVFVQFLAAGAVAVLVGVIAVGLTLFVITNVSKEATMTADEARKQAQELEAALERERQKNLAKQPTKPKIQEVQAAINIEPWQPIVPDMLKTVDIEGRPKPGVLTRPQDAIGKIVISPILAGEVITQDKLSGGDGIVLVEPGMRAITIQVDSIGNLDGAVLPGLLVDVLTTVTQEKGIPPTTRTLLQGVKVIAVRGDGNQKVRNTAGAVTLAVTPKQAEIITLANQVGKFHLTLRNVKDKAVTQVPGADLDVLLSGLERSTDEQKIPAPPATPEAGLVPVNYEGGLPNPSVAPQENIYSMNVFKGSSKEVVQFGQ